MENKRPGYIPKIRSYGGVLLATIVAALFLKTFVVEAYHIPSASMQQTLLIGDFVLVNKIAYGFHSPKRVPLLAAEIPFFRFTGLKRPQRGDVLVFDHPDARNGSDAVRVVKRCVGVAGDTILIDNGKIFVNGSLFSVNGVTHQNVMFPPEYIDERMYPPGSQGNPDFYRPVVVPAAGDEIVVTENNLHRWRVFIEREGHRVDVDGKGRVRIDGLPASVYVVERNYVFVVGDNRYNSLDSRFWGFLPEENIVGQALMVYWSWNPGEKLWDRFTNIRWGRIGMMIR